MKNPNPGNFAGVPEEMTNVLMRSDLTSREFRVVFFLIHEVIGKQLVRKLIKTEEFIKGTGMPKDHLIPAIRSLVEKGIIKRQSTSFRGCYFYEFHEVNFGRVIATKEIFEDKKGLKLIQGGKVSELDTSKNERVSELDTSNDPKVSELDTSSRSNLQTDSLREIHKSQRQKELDAHEERKREQIPKGSNAYFNFHAKLEEWKQRGKTA